MSSPYLANFIETCRMIKIEHSIFALPFAVASAFLAANGMPNSIILMLIILAMIFARSAAMAFNRYLDSDLDKKNPRTSTRSIPAGRLSRQYALVFTVVSSGCFLVVALALNKLAFFCAPFVLLILLGYSYTKHFTSSCHFVLGLALGLSPLGAWIAVRGEFAFLPVILGLAVTFWTAGFDLIYACQDIDFDKQQKLFSLPAKFGLKRSLTLSRTMHLLMLILLIYIGLWQQLSWIYWTGVIAVFTCLIYEHALVWDGQLNKLNTAFFTMNGIISLIFGMTTILSIIYKNSYL